MKEIGDRDEKALMRAGGHLPAADATARPAESPKIPQQPLQITFVHVSGQAEEF